jgi:glycosyltransferase involved in cell wall biosynthesis
VSPINNPALSLIVTVYNKEKWLQGTIDSLLSQTLRDIEIILIDDGSTDHSPRICDDCAKKDSRVNVFHQTNKGLGRARNRGLELAAGKYVLFIDADDWIAGNTCEKLYDKSRAESLDVLFFGVTGFIERTNTYRTYDDFSGFPSRIFNETLCYKDNAIFNHLFTMNHTAWSKLFNRDFLIRNHLTFAENLIFEDAEFFFRFIFKAKKIGFMPDGLYFYRQNISDSIIESKDKRYFDILKVLDLIQAELRKNGFFERLEYPYYRWKLALLKQRYREIRKELKSEFRKLITENLNRDKFTNVDSIFSLKDAENSCRRFISNPFHFLKLIKLKYAYIKFRNELLSGYP